MNNPDTDLTTILLNKFPEANLFKEYDKDDTKEAHNSIKTFLTFNFYNEKLTGEDEKNLYFKNLTTNRISIANMIEEKNTIMFRPFSLKDRNEEEKTFSLCNSGITCVRINEKGMFIEESSLIELPITIKQYDNETIKKISEDLPIEILYYLPSHLLDILTNEYRLKPDLLIKVAFLRGRYYKTEKRMRVDYYINQDIPYESYSYDMNRYDTLDKSNTYIEYLKYMYDQKLYSSNLIRIRKK